MKRRASLVGVARGCVWVALVLGVSGAWVVRAQQQPAPPSVAGTAGDPRFTGISTAMESKDLGVSRRRFEPGARSAWHYHSTGQLLFVELGRARTQKRGQPMRELGVGETDYTPGKVEHWHGAAPDQAFIQVAVGWGGDTTWLMRTTDEEYNGKAR
jgi:quercetin dioxygenase-like cupin family protein